MYLEVDNVELGPFVCRPVHAPKTSVFLEHLEAQEIKSRRVKSHALFRQQAISSLYFQKWPAGKMGSNAKSILYIHSLHDTYINQAKLGV